MTTMHRAPLSAIFVLAAATLLAFPVASAEPDPATVAKLQALADGPHRSEDHKARNRYRHPVETLAFFGLREDMTVVEISPGGAGWYTEILAPFLRARGMFFAASYDPDSEVEYFRRNAGRFEEKLASAPELYDRTVVTVFAPPDQLAIAPDGVADLVLTFRNLHNWMGDGHAPAVLAAVYRVLKPGGTFGVVQHRGDPRVPQDPQADSAYVNEDYAIALIESAGFRLVAKSEINANPRDTKDHPEGVWSLPPVLRLGDQDREKYLAIGESDRMTLKFIKPRERR